MLKESLDRYYYKMTISELKRLSGKDAFSGISYNSLLYMDLITYGDSPTPSKLAEMLNVSKPAVTSKVNELIKLGLVEKAENAADKRSFTLRPTPEAAEIYRSVDEAFEKAVIKLRQLYSPEEIASFCRILDSFTDIYTGEMENGNSTDKRDKL